MLPFFSDNWSANFWSISWFTYFFITIVISYNQYAINLWESSSKFYYEKIRWMHKSLVPKRTMHLSSLGSVVYYCRIGYSNVMIFYSISTTFYKIYQSYQLISSNYAFNIICQQKKTSRKGIKSRKHAQRLENKGHPVCWKKKKTHDKINFGVIFIIAANVFHWIWFFYCIHASINTQACHWQMMDATDSYAAFQKVAIIDTILTRQVAASSPNLQF